MKTEKLSFPLSSFILSLSKLLNTYYVSGAETTVVIQVKVAPALTEPRLWLGTQNNESEVAVLSTV